MIFLRLACVSFASLLFSQAVAKETQFVTLRKCDAKATSNDPTIVTQARVNGDLDCAESVASMVTIRDEWYGFETTAKPLLGSSSRLRVIEPTRQDVFASHEPCRFAYRDENGVFLGVFAEWLVPLGAPCKGRPSGAYLRVYTDENEICLRPGGGACIAVSKLTAEGQRRYHQTVRIAYESLAK